ncbi:MAG TPA: 50S ribosomal protein L13 [Candidatus Magasanikbacteria bacterium]|nr:50S ribosomal protein L13 [Candidatus Magasanikbacteria bacterium]
MNRKKIEIDAAGMAPGRLATKIAMILMGKHKVGYEPRLDKGDKVAILNVDKIKFTGKKLDQKVYRHHSNYPGGLKETPAKKVMKEDPKKVVILAVTKMLPKNKLRDGRLLRISFK